MIEAEITCECASLTLADLQLALTRGMVVYLDATRARNSKDLARAQRVRGVTVKYVQRYREQRPAPVTPAVPTPALVPVSSEARGVEGPVPFLDEEAIAQRVVALLAPQLQAIQEAIQALGQGTVVVVAAPQGHAPQVRAVPPVVGTVTDDVPVFIPSKIGRDDLRPTIAVATEGAADGGGVTDALAALKAARKSEKSR